VTPQRLTTRAPRKVARVLTQADLISEALETEDINRASLLAFYAAEEDRLNTERLAGMRHEIVGPKITFLSRSEGGGRGTGRAVIEIAEAKGKAKEVIESVGEKAERGRKRLIEVIGEAGKQGWRSGIDPVKEAGAVSSIIAPPTSGTTSRTTSDDVLPTNASNIFDASASSSTAEAAPPSSTNDDQTAPSTSFAPSSPFINGDTNASPPVPSSNAFGAPSSSLSTIPSTFTTPLPVVLAPIISSSFNSITTRSNATNEPASHTRNYLIVTGFVGTEAEEMGAIFGEHHEWGSVEVVANRDRVKRTSLAVSFCPLFGTDHGTDV
jgi:hypothetical protein